MAIALLATAGIYLACGTLFALAFVTRGVGSLDAAARGSGVTFRLLIFPASAALWPVLLLQWLQRTKP